MWPRNMKGRKQSPRFRRWPTPADVLRHPLTALVVGFFLTGVVGSFISKYNDSVNDDRRAQKQREDSAFKFSSVLVGQFAKARELADAIRRDAEKTEIQSKLDNYDKSVEAWHEELLLLPLTVNTLTVSTGEDIIDARSKVDGTTIVMDKCLRAAVSAKGYAAAVAVLDHCPLPSMDEMGQHMSPNEVKYMWRWMRMQPSFENQMERAIVCGTQFGKGIASIARSNDEWEPLPRYTACRYDGTTSMPSLYFWDGHPTVEVEVRRAPQFLIDLAANPLVKPPAPGQPADARHDEDEDWYYGWDAVTGRLYSRWVAPVLETMPLIGPVLTGVRYLEGDG